MRVISGRYKGRSLRTAEGPGYRPATGRVREALFSLLASRLGGFEGLRVLDLFAGSGSLGIEALSRGAALAWFVEKSRTAASVLADNLGSLGADPGSWRLFVEDVSQVLRRPPPEPFDLVFVDPPYRKGLLAPAMKLLTTKGWSAPGALVTAEVEAEFGPRDLAGESAGSLALEDDRLYGQTRILLWTN